MSTAGTYSCGVRLDDRIVCWGLNDFGQAPAAPSMDLFTDVSTADLYSCGVRIDGKLVCWGTDLFGAGPTL